MPNWCERWLPAIAAAFAIACTLVGHATGWDVRLTQQFDLLQVVSVTFNAIAFATPVTVALFAITLAPGGGFIQRLFGTNTYAMFVDYVITALVIGVTALCASAPFLAAKSGGAVADALWHFVPLWWAIEAAAVVAIGRVLLIFLVWARSYSRPNRVLESPRALSALGA